jgi:hypothetical protein
MGWLDRLCGACIGALKVFFCGWIFILIISSLPIAVVHHFFKDSRAYVFFVAISPVLKAKAAPAGALSGYPVLSDFGKKLTNVRAVPDSLLEREPASRHTRGPKRFLLFFLLLSGWWRDHFSTSSSTDFRKRNQSSGRDRTARCAGIRYAGGRIFPSSAIVRFGEDVRIVKHPYRSCIRRWNSRRG